VSSAAQIHDRAFESFYKLHGPQVFSYTLSLLRNVEDAEDATQTTFLNAYCALHRGVHPREDSRWLIAIARNVCRERYRDAKRRPRREPLADDLPAFEPDTPEYSLGELRRGLATLSPRQRLILVKREFEGRSYAEIGASLGVTQSAAQTLLAQARRTLREELKLPMTCEQARRLLVRDLNGVASIDERRALQRHIRRCADCATFAGRRRPLTLRTMLLLPWLPFRRLAAFFGSGSGVAATSKSAGTIATKIAAAAVAGTAAVGVTVGTTQLSTGTPPVRHAKPAPLVVEAFSPVHHAASMSRPAQHAFQPVPPVAFAGPAQRIQVNRTRRLGPPPSITTKHTAPPESHPAAAPAADSAVPSPAAPQPTSAQQPADTTANNGTPSSPDQGQPQVVEPATPETPPSPDPAAVATPPVDPSVISEAPSSNVASTPTSPVVNSTGAESITDVTAPPPGDSETTSSPPPTSTPTGTGQGQSQSQGQGQGSSSQGAGSGQANAADQGNGVGPNGTPPGQAIGRTARRP
jgi:RNA polymerase sigma-70 factor (ECF subfamily)